MRTLPRLLAALLICATLASQPGAAQVSLSIGFNSFQSGLSPYGQWVNVGAYGQVWSPTVSYGWRPYSTGHWIYSNQGWVWMTAEPWGWATYHYGRWVFDANYGWCWVPGAVWAPSWVSWYVGPNYIGWYPLGPQGYPPPQPAWLVFVPTRNFLANNVGNYMLPPAQNVTIIQNTAVINNINVFNRGSIINPGPNVASVQRWTGQPVPQVNVVSGTFNANQLAQGGSRIQGNTLYAFRPTVQPMVGGPSTPLLRAEATGGQVWLGNHAATFRAAGVAPGAAFPNSNPALNQQPFKARATVPGSTNGLRRTGPTTTFKGVPTTTTGHTSPAFTPAGLPGHVSRPPTKGVPPPRVPPPAHPAKTPHI